MKDIIIIKAKCEVTEKTLLTNGHGTLKSTHLCGPENGCSSLGGQFIVQRGPSI